MDVLCKIRRRVRRGAEFSLYKHIDLDNVLGFNEALPGSAKTIFKPWDARFDESKFIESDADEQLIIFIPFTGNIKLKSIAVRGYGEQSPAKMKAYINRDIVDFSAIETIQSADQEWDLVDPTVNSVTEVPEYPTRLTKFGNVRNLTLFFPANVGDAETTKIVYIGLKGEWTELNKDPVITLYELAANPADHKRISAEDGASRAVDDAVTNFTVLLYFCVFMTLVCTVLLIKLIFMARSKGDSIATPINRELLIFSVSLMGTYACEISLISCGYMRQNDVGIWSSNLVQAIFVSAVIVSYVNCSWLRCDLVVECVYPSLVTWIRRLVRCLPYVYVSFVVVNAVEALTIMFPTGIENLNAILFNVQDGIILCAGLMTVIFDLLMLFSFVKFMRTTSVEGLELDHSFRIVAKGGLLMTSVALLSWVIFFASTLESDQFVSEALVNAVYVDFVIIFCMLLHMKSALSREKIRRKEETNARIVNVLGEKDESTRKGISTQ
ncbi:hypothetical protein HDU82_005914 [Entophlyctis luteolus]|nr:hypothetical protein HDU82_005914 [Entophlyctis luteolus]